MRSTQRSSSKGFVLLASLLLLLLLSALALGMVYIVQTETTLGGTDLENNVAYYGAESAMEKMMVDLNALYAARQSPTVAEIQALGNAVNHPTLPSITYPEYSFTVPNTGGVPDVEVRTISGGPNQGLVADITPMFLTATARRLGGAEVKMTRDIEMALIPVFQFGIFSDTDLSYFPGPNFNFAGRVHTNGSLFIATGGGSSLTFTDRITAVQEVIRRELSNGLDTVGAGRTGPIWVPTAPGGCPACRDLDEDEGSKVAGPTSADNVNWVNLSTSIYNGMILNGDTGARPLNLPFVAPGLRSIELIRRPPQGENPLSLVGQSRLYNQAQIRVLLNDNPADLPGGAGDPENVQLANVGAYAGGVPVVGANPSFFAEADTAIDADWVSPDGGVTTQWPLLDGYLRVEIRRANGTYLAVTREWLQLGFARGLQTPDSEFGVANSVHPNAILIFQTAADRNMDGDLADGGEIDIIGTPALVPAALADSNNWYPLNLYDTREGEVRNASNNGDTSCAIGGVMNTIELDVNNLRRWLAGITGLNGLQTESASQNGYILSFSDRRGMLPDPNEAPPVVLGEYGFEDMINPPILSGAPNGNLDNAEDVNLNGRLDTYGAANLGTGFGVANGDPTVRLANCAATGRKNRVSGARHALKLVNGTLGNVPRRPAGTGGFTVAAENIVYIRGNYNANNAGFGDPHAAASIISDAVSFLSQRWDNESSFASTNYTGNGTARWALTSSYRVAVAAGKNISFPRPAWGGTGNPSDFGTDGGTHNFLRYLERWRANPGNARQDFNYRGSLVSLYFSEYAVGIYKCCGNVYSPPGRIYAFDTDFLDPTLLPPGTPRFRDVINLGFKQVFIP